MSILTVFLPKRGHQPFSRPMATLFFVLWLIIRQLSFGRCSHQPFSCPMATLFFVLWLIIRQLSFERRSHQPFSCPMATEYDGMGQLSERCLYFLAIHISYPQRKTFDAGLLRLTGSDRIYIFLHHIQEQRFCLHRKIIVRPNRKKQKNFYQETGISLYAY